MWHLNAFGLENPDRYAAHVTSAQIVSGLVTHLKLDVTWSVDGQHCWYPARDADGKAGFTLVDIAAGEKSFVRKADLPEAAKVVTTVDEAAVGMHGTTRSPDGKWEMFLRDSNIWLRNSVSKAESQYSYEATTHDNYWTDVYWSLDSKKFVAFRFRWASTRKVEIIESAPADQLQPKVITLDYAKPGDSIAQGRPVLFQVGKPPKQVIPDDTLFQNPYQLSHAHWDAKSETFTFLCNHRGHQRQSVIAIDAVNGETRAVIDETCKTFFDYSNKTYWRQNADGSHLWMSERSGWNHLYLVGKNGSVKNAVTAGEWVVRGVDRVDDNAKTVWLRVMGYHAGEDPYHVHHARVNFDGSGFTLLDDGDGMHDLQWSPRRDCFIDTWSTIESPPKHVLRNAEGKKLLALETADATAVTKLDWKPPERFALPGRDGKTLIYGYIVRPRNFDPKKTYPVIESIYAGPHDHHVPQRYHPTLYESPMAELGFIVVKMDGMGTNWRSKAFHDVCWKNLADAGFPDRIAVIKALAKKHPEMDLSKGVGIYGGSAGGQNTLAGLLHHSDFYTVGVADCGCHDNRMDKIWWNEAWMGWPVGPHYGENSNVTHAAKLKGKLMLVVGEVDRNVDPASTMQVVAALIKANKDFDFLIMPGVGHGAAEWPYASRRRAEFFVRHLQ